MQTIAEHQRPLRGPLRPVTGNLLATVLSLLVIATPAHAQDLALDGNWWRVADRQQKQYAVLGFLQGVNHGCQLSGAIFEDGFPVKGTTVTTHCASNTKTFGPTTVEQSIDGLDTLYADFRNRSIPFGMGMWFVANQASGARQVRVDELLDAMRRQSTR